MLLSPLLTALLLTALPGAPPSIETPRIQAAEVLELAIRSAEQDGLRGSATLEDSLEAARRILGTDSEAAAQLERLARGVRFEAYLAGDDGTPWLVQQLPPLISDLRFEPVQEAALPPDFPEWTPVGEIQIQRYPAYRLARTSMQSPGSNGAFWKLFNHIQSNDIAMTAPVETTFTLEEESPVQSSMAFLYGSRSLGQLGKEGAVEVVDIPAQVVVSAGLRGFERPERIADACRRLEQWLLDHPAWVAAGPPRSMGHNSPMVFGDRRYFEVQIPVKRANATVIDFNAAGEASSWRPVDDAVMGGRSSSRVEVTPEGTCAFTGELSLENNGGFASVRRVAEDGAFAGASAVVLRVRGDGKTYRLRFRTDARGDSPSYQADFETVAGEWIDVQMELVEFELKWRGRAIPEAPLLDAERIRGIGLLIANEQTGPFRLELASLGKL